jgi:ubiquinone/menaquinone biosynthesis C-methylase UbiE
VNVNHEQTISRGEYGSLKESVRRHWDAEPCGTRDIPESDRRRFFRNLERDRYAREPYIHAFARFARGRGRDVLEVGVGAGTDFVNWVRHGAQAQGVDLTLRGVELTRERLSLEGLHAEVRIADAERLPFADESFDIVYSYGVLHHSPDTAHAIREVERVLRPGGTALVMIYHVPSWVGFMLWTLHCAAKLRPWRSPRWAIYHYLESPGTKAYTKGEARRMFAGFREARVWTQLSHGDLLLMRPGEKYAGWLHRLLWRLYPRWLVRRTGNVFGTNLFIEAVK